MPGDPTPNGNYHERSLFGSCRFTLYSDRLELVGRRNFNVDFENQFPLDDLSSTISKTRLRHPWWIAGVLMQFVPYSMYLLLRASRQLEHGFVWWLVALVCTIGVGFELLSLWLILAGFPKREYFFFRRLNGVETFHIGRSGPDRDRFDEFVASIQRQAEVAKTQTPVISGSKPVSS